ncbi:MAG: heavy metal-binding domain-containing protein [Tissierellia bacterium]|nr:heavy metal-binding domain-containing protein [Tissierellia bacterium]
MIVTTTNNIEGREITEYIGIVFGEVITGVNFIKDIGAGLRDIFGGRSQGYEDELIMARNEAISEIMTRAVELNADAVVACKMDYEVLGQSGSMMMVTISGTAVKLK